MSRPPTILVIDDDPSLRDALRRTLRSKSYVMLEAAEGGEGLMLCKAHAVDVVVVDLFMPGKEGLETIRELRRSFPHIKIVAMSGGGTKGDVDVLLVAKAMGGHHILVKPFSKEDLLKAIDAQLM